MGFNSGFKGLMLLLEALEANDWPQNRFTLPKRFVVSFCTGRQAGPLTADSGPGDTNF